MGDISWGHAESDDAEQWEGAFDTREACIEDGCGSYDGDFWIVSGTHPDASEFFPDAEWILEDAGQRAYDTLGDVAEDFPDVSAEATAELDALILAWVEKHIICSFYAADGPKERITNPRKKAKP